MNKINNYSVYNQRMNASMLDKMFFMDKINTPNLVDFGCADGSLLKCIAEVFRTNPSFYIGYDNDCEMVKVAKKNLAKLPSFVTCDWDAIPTKEKSTLILSSVIHEVYHYSSPKEITEFWNRVFGSNFEYIAIRDMVPHRSIERPSDINDIMKIRRRCAYHGYGFALDSFENIWGSISNNKALVHFLLKHQYIFPNWNREVKENYMPLTHEAILEMIPTNYEIAYHEHYTLPYIKQCVKREFDIDLKDNTHLKLLLKRK